MNEQLVQPEPPDPLVEETRTFWRETSKTLIREPIGTVDETARQIIGVAGILEGLYFHAIAFTGLHGKVKGDALIIYLAPVALLLISLAAGLLVYFPLHYRVNFNSSEASQLVYERTVSRKLKALRIASVFLALGVAAILPAVFTYLAS